MSGVAISEAIVAIENSAKYVFKVDYLRRRLISHKKAQNAQNGSAQSVKNFVSYVPFCGQIKDWTESVPQRAGAASINAISSDSRVCFENDLTGLRERTCFASRIAATTASTSP